MSDEFTQSVILDRLLSRVPEGLDKREGSIIYDALAPAAWEISQCYRLLFSAVTESFIATAEGGALDLRVEEMGLERLTASKTIRKGVFTDTSGNPLPVSIGARFTTMDAEKSQNFIVLSEIEAGAYRLEAETAGKVGNEYVGVLSPITHIEGLGAATITDVLIQGEDAESDESLRARYFEYIKSNLQDGNAAQYYTWASEYPGIGKSKVFPLWNGANTVKISILDADNTVASNDLIADFQKYLDPGCKGLGNGVAPIGAKVTVATATEKTVDISASISVVEGYLFSDVKSNIETALTKFFADIAYQSEAVFLMSVGAEILNTEGVAYATDLKLNNTQSDIALGVNEIGAIGTITFTEVVI